MLKIIFPMDRNVGRTLFLSICGPENVPSECVSVYFSPLNSGNEEKNKTVKLGGPMRCSSKPTHPGFWCGQHVWHMMHSSCSTLLTLQGSLEVKTKQSWKLHSEHLELLFAWNWKGGAGSITKDLKTLTSLDTLRFCPISI